MAPECWLALTRIIGSDLDLGDESEEEESAAEDLHISETGAQRVCFMVCGTREPWNEHVKASVLELKSTLTATEAWSTLRKISPTLTLDVPEFPVVSEEMHVLRKHPCARWEGVSASATVAARTTLAPDVPDSDVVCKDVHALHERPCALLEGVKVSATVATQTTHDLWHDHFETRACQTEPCVVTIDTECQTDGVEECQTHDAGTENSGKRETTGKGSSLLSLPLANFALPQSAPMTPTSSPRADLRRARSAPPASAVTPRDVLEDLFTKQEYELEDRVDLLETALDNVESATVALTRLRSQNENPWSSPVEELSSAGSLLESVTEAVDAVSELIESLMKNDLVVDDTYTVMRMPKALDQRREFLDERLCCVDGSLFTVMKWAHVEPGRRLTKMKGEVMPPSCVLDCLLDGPRKLNNGDVLTFARRIPEGAEDMLGSIVARTGSLVADLRQASLSLPVDGPSRDQEANSTIVTVWEMRLQWEEGLQRFEELLGQFRQCVDSCCDEGRAQAKAMKGEPLVAQGSEMDTGEGNKGRGVPSIGKSGGKGPGLPPTCKSGGKGPCLPLTGKSGGKGPCLPLTGKSGGKGPGLPLTGKSGGKGLGLPPKGKSGGKGLGLPPNGKLGGRGPGPPPPGTSRDKGVGLSPLSGDDGTGPKRDLSIEGRLRAGSRASFSQIDEAARQHAATLFGEKIQAPRKDMLSTLHLPYETYLNKMSCGDHVDVHDAFGGRGALLFHACIGTNPPASKKKVPTQKAAEKVQVIQGKMGAVGDLRRFDQERRFKCIPKCEPEWFAAGNSGLGVPHCDHNAWAAHELGRVIASLDFGGFHQLVKGGYIDLGHLIPEVEISIHQTKRDEETEKLKTSFLARDEADRIIELVKEGQIQQMESLERQILPLAYVPELPEKVMLFRISELLEPVEGAAMTQVDLVRNACDSLRTSQHLSDLLRVMVQMANYVANFGDSESGQGFSLMKIKQYEDFALGRYPFLTVLCTFIMNLRPLKKKNTSPRQHKVSRQVSRVMHKDLAEPLTAVKERKTEQPRCLQEHQNAAENVDTQEEKSFLDQLENDLRDARKVVQQEIKKDLFKSYQQEAETMGHVVAAWIGREEELFNPVRSSAFSKPSDAERFMELAAWCDGREHLRELHNRVRSLQRKLADTSSELDASEKSLQEFAALRPQDFQKVGYFELFEVIVGFVDRFTHRWEEITKKPNDQMELMRAILAAHSLTVLFEKNSQEKMLELWRFKKGHKMSPRWTEEERRDTIQRLFRLFDCDGSGSVDVSELELTLKACGIDMADNSDAKFYAFQCMDTFGDCEISAQEFEAFVSTQIEGMFGLLLDGEGEEEADWRSAAITVDHLRRAAANVKASTFEDVELLDMVRSVDFNGDGRISLSAFEQVVLMVPTHLRIDVTALAPMRRHEVFDEGQAHTLELRAARRSFVGSCDNVQNNFGENEQDRGEA